MHCWASPLFLRDEHPYLNLQWQRLIHSEIRGALFLLVSLAWGESWAQIMSVLCTNILLTIYARSLLHKAKAKQISMFFLTASITPVGHSFGLGQENQPHTQHTMCCIKRNICQSVGQHSIFKPCYTDWWQLPELWQWEMGPSQMSCLSLSETVECQNTTSRTSGHPTGAAEKSGKPNAHCYKWKENHTAHLLNLGEYLWQTTLLLTVITRTYVTGCSLL